MKHDLQSNSVTRGRIVGTCLRCGKSGVSKDEECTAPITVRVRVSEQQVTRREWDDTMRAALAGLIARDDSRTSSYDQLVMQAHIYAQAAHGKRP